MRVDGVRRVFTQHEVACTREPIANTGSLPLAAAPDVVNVFMSYASERSAVAVELGLMDVTEFSGPDGAARRIRPGGPRSKSAARDKKGNCLHTAPFRCKAR